MSTLPDPVGGPFDGVPSPRNSRLPVDLEFDEDGKKPAQEKFTPQLIWRAFRRHWWQILAVWAVGSAGVVYMANQRIKTAYDVSARVRVEPGEQPLHVNKSIMSGSDLAEFREVQISTVTSPVVINLALADHPELYRLPRLQNTDDAEGVIRGSIKVAPIIKTPLMEISMTSNSADEAVAIVNAVVEAYLKNAASLTSDETKQRIEQLRKGEEDYQRELEEKRRDSLRLSERFGAADIEGVKDSNSITSDDYRLLSDQLAKVEIERVTLEAELEHFRRQKLAPPPTAVDDGQINEAVEDALKTHPAVQDLQEEVDRINAQVEQVQRGSRHRSDPALMALQRKLSRLKNQLMATRKSLRPKLKRQLQPPPPAEGEDEAVNSTERRLVALKKHEDYLREKLKVMKIRTQRAGAEAMQLQFANFDTSRAAEVLHKVQDSLHQLEHESRNPLARVRLEYPARMPKHPNPNSKGRVIMMGPIAVFGMILGLFVLLERRSARVANPEDLPGRARLQVLGVVPPLPTLRQPAWASIRGEGRGQRLLDEFVQSLDHLRVTLCARPDPWGRDRHCLLITSACGSEGKTTLAAQLAERCVNAGLMTLLIDADLRNPTLTRMFDFEASDGLVNVLRGDVEAEHAIRVVGDAGGFHFLAAGTPRTDPSRILQGEALGKFLARARESFEMIIVDAPPVLPVPDALTIGRWTDGAVLAVRHDTSRIPAVERAQRRLASVGVPVLGAVVNGVRSAGSTYGGYAYGNLAGSSSTEA